MKFCKIKMNICYVFCRSPRINRAWRIWCLTLIHDQQRQRSLVPTSHIHTLNLSQFQVIGDWSPKITWIGFFFFFFDKSDRMNGNIKMLWVPHFILLFKVQQEALDKQEGWSWNWFWTDAAEKKLYNLSVEVPNIE